MVVVVVRCHCNKQTNNLDQHMLVNKIDHMHMDQDHQEFVVSLPPLLVVSDTFQLLASYQDDNLVHQGCSNLICMMVNNTIDNLHGSSMLFSLFLYLPDVYDLLFSEFCHQPKYNPMLQ